MGYSTTGDFSITFANEGMMALATDALNKSPDQRRKADDFFEAFSSVWDCYEGPVVGEDDSITFGGYVVDKWITENEDFGPVVAPFARDLSGDFLGEDGTRWGWEKVDGEFREFYYVQVPDYEHKDFQRDSAAIQTLLEAVTGQNVDTIMQVAKTLCIPYMNPDQLAAYADDPDEKVAALVTARIMQAVN